MRSKFEACELASLQGQSQLRCSAGFRNAAPRKTREKKPADGMYPPVGGGAVGWVYEIVWRAGRVCRHTHQMPLVVGSTE